MADDGKIRKQDEDYTAAVDEAPRSPNMPSYPGPVSSVFMAVHYH